ncbi:MAG: pilus assembly protein PilM [Opitutales bacterium]|nr:pilus assembly protein PilM [Opitutales bacterium]
MSSGKLQQVLNCGSQHLSFGVFSESDGDLSLERFDYEPLAGEITSDEDWISSLIEGLREITSRQEIKGKVSLIFPGHLLLTKFIKVPSIAESKRDQIIRFEAQQNIPYPLNEVVWDYEIVSDDGAEFEVALVAIKLEIVEQVCGLLASMDLQVERINPSSMAQLNAFTFQEPEVEEPLLIANIGAKSSNLLFLSEDSFYIRNISLAGNQLTQSIAEASGDSFAEAEELKQNTFAEGLDDNSPETVLNAANSFIRKFSMELTRSIVNFRRQSGAEKVGRVVLTGGGSMIPGLAEQMEEKLKSPVEVLDPFTNVSLGEGIDTDFLEQRQYALPELLGVAVHAIRGSAKVDFNLVPPAILARARLNRQKPYYVGAAALIALGLLFPLWQMNRATAANENAASQLESGRAVELTVDELTATNRQVQNNLEKISDLRAQVALFDLTLARSNRWIDLLAQLENTFNQVEDAWLDSLRLEIVDPSADRQLQRTPRRRGPADEEEVVEEEPIFNLVITGRMLDRANPLSTVSSETRVRTLALLDNLEQSMYIEEKTQDSYDTSRSGILTFSVNLRLNNDLPL